MGSNELDRLNELVSYAVFHAEGTAPLSDAMTIAYTALSRIEERIAEITDPASVEGGVARRGAIRAALVAGDIGKAQELADRYGIPLERLA